MITSIEPGVYRPGQWGVRIENLVLNVPVDTPEGGAFGEMLAFETLTLCPIDTRCIDRRCCAPTNATGSTATTSTVRERLRRGSAATRWPGCCSAPSRSRPADADGAAHPAPSVSTSAAPRSRPCCSTPHGRERWRERVASPRGSYDESLQAIAGVGGARQAGAPAGAPCTIGIGTPGNVTRTRRDEELQLHAAQRPPAAARPRGAAAASRCAWPTMPIAWRCRRPPTAPAPAPTWCSPPSSAPASAPASRCTAACSTARTDWPANGATTRCRGPRGDEPRHRCFCGQRGCIETLLSGPGLARDHAEHARRRAEAPSRSPTCAAHGDAACDGHAAALGDAPGARAGARDQPARPRCHRARRRPVAHRAHLYANVPQLLPRLGVRRRRARRAGAHAPRAERCTAMPRACAAPPGCGPAGRSPSPGAYICRNRCR